VFTVTGNFVRSKNSARDNWWMTFTGDCMPKGRTSRGQQAFWHYQYIERERFTERRKASLASAATANQSVRLSVCPSVTLRYCVRTRGRRKMQSSPPGSPESLVFWCHKGLYQQLSVSTYRGRAVERYNSQLSEDAVDRQRNIICCCCCCCY